MPRRLTLKARQQSLLLSQKIPRKPKLLRSNPTRFSLYLHNSPRWFEIDDEDILTGYNASASTRRQRDIELDDSDEDDLSDYVKFRLWLARQLALKKFDEVRGMG